MINLFGDVGFVMRLRRLVRPDVEEPLKVDAADFGGGKSRGVYTQGEVERRLCSVGGCPRHAHACWSGCADGNVQRPLCAEHDVEINRTVQEWWGDPDWEAKIVAYANRMQADMDRPLELPWLIPSGETDEP